MQPKIYKKQLKIGRTQPVEKIEFQVKKEENYEFK